MPVNDDLANEQWQRFTYLRDNGHLDFVAKADKCDNYFVGNQWLEADMSALQAQRRPALTINKIISTVNTILGDQILNRTEVLFRPNNGAPADTADALSKVWMQISQNNQLPWVRSEVFCDGVIRSRGFYDVRLDFSDNMQGEVRIIQLNGKNVLIDNDADEYDPSSWGDVITTKWQNYQDIATLYSQADADYLKDKSGSSYPYGYDSIEQTRGRFGGPEVAGSYLKDEEGVRRNIRVIERQHRKLGKYEHFVDVKNGDTRLIPADWDRNRIADLLAKTGGTLSTIKKLAKRIRWTVTADNVVLHDDWSPYQHFTVVPYFPVFRYGQTVGIVENLLGPQEILNKVSSQELHVVNTTANSGWVVEEGSLANMSIEELEAKGATTGLVIEHRRGTTPPSKIVPNQTPTGLDRISYKAEEHIKTISNVTDSMQGNDREDVAAKAIAYKQQRSSVTHSKVLDNLERSDWMLARNVLALVQEFYTEERIIDIVHEDFTQEQESITVNEMDPVTGEIKNDLTLGEYDIVITSSPYRSSLEDSQFEQARALKELGIAIPDSVLIENSRLMRRAEILKQMQGDKESPEAQAAAQLKQRSDEATVAGLEADTALKQATAQKTQSEAAGGNQAEIEKLQMEMQVEREKMEMEREKMQAELEMKERELQMKQREHAQNLAMKQQEHEQDAQLKQQAAEQQAVAQRAQALRGDATGDSQTAKPTL